jgi:hypothetical protein
MSRVNSFDIDGVIYINDELIGVYPGKDDFIITGRSFEEMPETIAMLEARGIFNEVFFNPIPFDEKSRKSSGMHKANILNDLKSQGFDVGIHFEDDEIQAEVINDFAPWVHVVHLVHELSEKENRRHV